METNQPNKSSRNVDNRGEDAEKPQTESRSITKILLLIMLVVIVTVLVGIILLVWYRYTGRVDNFLTS